MKKKYYYSMATYDLIILCPPQTYTISVHSDVSVNEIIRQITSRFNLIGDSFFLEIYDERIEEYVDFDDRYHEELRQRLPKTHQKTLCARVTHLEGNANNEDFDSLGKFSSKNDCLKHSSLLSFTDNLLLSSETSVKSPIGISTMDEEIRIDTATDMDSARVFKYNYNG